LSRFAGVSEAPAERESAGEILSERSEPKDSEDDDAKAGREAEGISYILESKGT